jgi:hypothetical protein
MTTARIETVRHGLMADFSETQFPTMVFGVKDWDVAIDLCGTAYGYVEKGFLTAYADGRAIPITPKQAFAIPAQRKLMFRPLASVTAFVAFRMDYIGLPTIVGPVEEPCGRLKYIDGCSDTLLIGPPLKGDPCFNLLHFPVSIDQTKHTHPSIRVGLIHRGEGYCETAEGGEALLPGSVFILAPDAIHAFHTPKSSGMDLTVYHPDSDCGPSHEDHPMLNRTIVEGTSAKQIAAIRTKELAS